MFVEIHSFVVKYRQNNNAFISRIREFASSSSTRHGSYRDNAVAENFFNLLKRKRDVVARRVRMAAENESRCCLEEGVVQQSGSKFLQTLYPFLQKAILLHVLLCH